jgi:hypothetical protein
MGAPHCWVARGCGRATTSAAESLDLSGNLTSLCKGQTGFYPQMPQIDADENRGLYLRLIWVTFG